jgi:hypothetical protein
VVGNDLGLVGLMKLTGNLQEQSGIERSQQLRYRQAIESRCRSKWQEKVEAALCYVRGTWKQAKRLWSKKH